MVCTPTKYANVKSSFLQVVWGEQFKDETKDEKLTDHGYEGSYKSWDDPPSIPGWVYMVVKSMGYEVWNAPERPEPQKLPVLYFPHLPIIPLAYDGSLQVLMK